MSVCLISWWADNCLNLNRNVIKKGTLIMLLDVHILTVCAPHQTDSVGALWRDDPPRRHSFITLSQAMFLFTFLTIKRSRLVLLPCYLLTCQSIKSPRGCSTSGRKYTHHKGCTASSVFPKDQGLTHCRPHIFLISELLNIKQMWGETLESMRDRPSHIPQL